jgi:hypothetical protein
MESVSERVAIMINYTRGVEMRPSYDGMEQSSLRFLPAPLERGDESIG